MRLPYDVARCPNEECHLSHDCLRWLSPGRLDGMQPISFFAVPKAGEDCPHQIPVKGGDT